VSLSLTLHLPHSPPESLPFYSAKRDRPESNEANGMNRHAAGNGTLGRVWEYLRQSRAPIHPDWPCCSSIAYPRHAHSFGLAEAGASVPSTVPCLWELVLISDDSHALTGPSGKSRRRRTPGTASSRARSGPDVRLAA
jgi:hypothetical protein